MTMPRWETFGSRARRDYPGNKWLNLLPAAPLVENLPFHSNWFGKWGTAPSQQQPVGLGANAVLNWTGGGGEGRVAPAATGNAEYEPLPHGEEEGTAGTYAAPMELNPAYQWLVDKGWFAKDPNQASNANILYTGNPDTRAQKSFIMDYINKYGARPTNEMTMKGTAGAPEEYIPGSVMYDLGFRTPEEYLAAQGRGRTYGPWSGAQVPFGTVVTTDERGQPTGRYTGQESPIELRTLETLMGRGQYYKPPEYAPNKVTEMFGAGAKPSRWTGQLGELYPDRPAPEPYTGGEQLDYRGAAKGILGSWVNDLTTISDSLITAYENQVAQKAQELRTTEGLNEKDAKAKAAQMVTPPTAGELARAAFDLVEKYQERNLDPLSQQYLNQLKSDLMDYRRDKRDIPSLEAHVNQMLDGITAHLAAQNPYAAQERARGEQAAWEGRQPKGPVGSPKSYNTGNEQAEYEQWVGSLGLAPPISQWLMQNYSQIYRAWRANGMGQPLTAFAEQYLGGQ